MAWFFKQTSISGYDSHEPTSSEINVKAWRREHRKVLYRRGHWSPVTALRAGRQAGFVGQITVEHTTSDLNGKGRGGIDKRFTVDETETVIMSIPEDENAAWSAQDEADVWESESA